MSDLARDIAVIKSRIDEMDRRYTERFEGHAAALHKAETALERRFESVNEMRAMLTDRDKSYMPRAESDTRYASMTAKIDDHDKQDVISHAAINARIDGITRRIDLREGELLGGKDSKGDARANIAIVISIVGAMFLLVSFIQQHLK